MPAQVPSAPRVQEAVAKVFRRPEFQEHHGIGEWVNEHVTRVLFWIVRELQAFAGLKETHPVVFYTVIAWLCITALAIVAHLVWTAVQAARGGDDGPKVKAERSPGTKPRTAQEWEAEAARLAASGRLREAAVALYHALLLRLDARGAVRFDPSKTPGDYRREARAHPDAARTLASFLRLFEPVAFGGRPLDADGWERLKGAALEGAHG